MSDFALLALNFTLPESNHNPDPYPFPFWQAAAALNVMDRRIEQLDRQQLTSIEKKSDTAFRSDAASRPAASLAGNFDYAIHGITLGRGYIDFSQGARSWDNFD